VISRTPPSKAVQPVTLAQVVNRDFTLLLIHLAFSRLLSELTGCENRYIVPAQVT
jgi:hypothetical protein